ncbi:hypothetical protein LCGC14_2537140 [marine sediment metagenome]|uniref:Uncharacterized protein n=1 Tax=marine sediment metagenome TaxID=412755 RepID=A0A0F9DJW0_9ZZZZ
MIAPIVPTDEQIRHRFVQMLSELSSRLSRRFAGQGVERREERVAEGVALSWQNFLNGSRRGKTLSASNLAWAAGKAVLSGRRLGGSCSVDALANGHRGPDLGHLLDKLEQDGKGIYVLIADRRTQWPVIEYVWPKLDMVEFRRRCAARDRLLMSLKMSGLAQTKIADVLGITPARVCQRLGELRRQWQQLGAA